MGVCGMRMSCQARSIEHSTAPELLCCGNGGRKAVSCGLCTGKPAQKPCWVYYAPLRLQSSRRRAMGSGVGRKSAASSGHTTDLVHWLQAGKTVDISRRASESTDLLPPSALPRSLRSLRLSPPTRPAAGRPAAAAAHRAADMDIGGSAAVGGDGGDGESKCQRRGIVIDGIGVSIYRDLRQCRLSSVSASILPIGDLETFDDARLSAKFCVLPVRRSVQGLRCPQSLRPGASVRCEGKEKAVSGGRFVGNKAAKTTLLGLLCSSMSAEPPPKSRIKWKKVCSQQPGKPVSSLHPICPQPRWEE